MAVGTRVLARPVAPRYALKGALIAKGFTLGQVAGLLGVKATALSAVLNGRRGPTPEMEERLAAYLGVPVEQLP